MDYTVTRNAFSRYVSTISREAFDPGRSSALQRQIINPDRNAFEDHFNACRRNNKMDSVRFFANLGGECQDLVSDQWHGRVEVAFASG